MTFVPDGYHIKTEFDPRFRENGCIPFTTEQIDAISAEYLAGSSSYEIGEKYGVHASTVLNILKKAGVELRPRGPIRHTTPEVIQDALALRAGGADWSQVQELLGVRWEAIAVQVRQQRKAEREEVEQLRLQVAKLEHDLACMRGSCAKMGHELAEQKQRAKSAERGFQATQRALSWIMHHRNVSIEGLPGWVLGVLKRILKRDQEPIDPDK